MHDVELWFEYASTYSYPAAMRAEAACSSRGFRLIWRPFLLGPVFRAQGLETSPFILNPRKGAYMWRDLARICAAEGLGFRRPSTFPRGSLLAARIACTHAKAAWIGRFIRAVYVANFADDRDIGSPEVIARLLRDLGVDGDSIMASAQVPTAKSALREQTDRALSLDIFGAPTFVVGDEIFWGFDRMTMALDHAARA